MTGDEQHLVETENQSTETRDLPRELEAAVRQRAFEISESADAGSPEANWLRAENELSAGTRGDSDLIRHDELAAAEDEGASALLYARVGALGHP